MKKTPDLFDNWNEEKKKLEFCFFKRKRIKPGEIWISKIGVNIGSEISKNYTFSRPVLIISSNMGGDLVSIVPFTTKYNKKHSKFYYKINKYEIFGLKTESYLCLNQFKTISAKRLYHRINGFNRSSFNNRLVDYSIINELLNRIVELNKKTP